LTCYKCESNQQNSACTTGVTNLEDDFMGEERCPASTSNTGQINTRSYCYVWQYSMGDGLTIYRGCASTENNPCVGPNYSVCHYRLCETSYCNSSSRLSPPPFLTQLFRSVFVTLVLTVLLVKTLFF
ncbi:uncharacterized protein LOC142356261, partial [Convolutriloba macropyga]|uniref:uncharacterized protein LOC142356261 n=1 Tax=Convolutriloba macropyga TaxID=536237 RepID=UPI003F5246E1